MNMYFVYDDGHIVTPETGTILEGITRSSIIELAGKLGHQVEERRFSIDEWRDGVDQRRDHRGLRVRHRRGGDPGRRAASGTAARSPAPASTDLTMKIRQALVDVQYGRAEDTFGWMHQGLLSGLQPRRSARPPRRSACATSSTMS